MSDIRHSLQNLADAISPETGTRDGFVDNVETSLARISQALPKKLGGKIEAESLAAEYDDQATYDIGDYCTHDGVFYICATAIAIAESWNSAKWVAVPIIEILQEKLNAPADGAVAGRYLMVGQNGEPVWGQLDESDIRQSVYDWLSAHPEAIVVNDGTITRAKLDNSVGQAVDEVSELKADFDEVAEYYEPINLFNKNSALIRDGYKISGSGNYASQSGGSVSHPIKIQEGNTYSFKYSVGFYGTLANSIVRPCDAEGNLILSSLGDPVLYATTSPDNAYGTFTVPQEWPYDYVCVNVRTSDKGVMIFAEAETLPAYSDYFDPYYKIKTSALPSPLPLPDNAQNNVLYGKKAAFTGDSICYGAGFSGGYPSIIGSNNNMTISNIGQSGGTLCSGTNRFCISARVDNMPEGYDYYIVEGGVNDASQEHGETLGSLSSGYNATLDTATLYGAMETLCKKLQLNFKGKKYGFVIPHNVYGDTSVWNTGWREAMKTCLKKWGIPYIDLSEECAQLRNLDALRIYTSNGDGWHPTEDGYKLYYVPKIEAWMKTL